MAWLWGRVPRRKLVFTKKHPILTKLLTVANCYGLTLAIPKAIIISSPYHLTKGTQFPG